MIVIEDKSLRIPVPATGEGWLVVDKPAGITVHNTPGSDVCSLVSAFIRKEPSVIGLEQADPGFSVHPVHRLDKETSGLLLLAGTPHLFRFFSKQFEDRRVNKRYIAILHGRLADAPGEKSWGTWTWALSKAAGGRHRPEGGRPRQPAHTRYRIADRSAHYTMVEIELHSGRKHQIRRHAKLAGHPVAGDARYGSKRAIRYLKKRGAFDRLALHAHALTFRLPERNAPKTITSPSLPDPMQALFAADREAHKP